MKTVKKGTVGEGVGEEEERKAKKNSESKKAIRIVFWNIAELKRKDRFLGLLRKV